MMTGCFCVMLAEDAGIGGHQELDSLTGLAQAAGDNAWPAMQEEAAMLHTE